MGEWRDGWNVALVERTERKILIANQQVLRRRRADLVDAVALSPLARAKSGRKGNDDPAAVTRAVALFGTKRRGG